MLHRRHRLVPDADVRVGEDVQLDIKAQPGAKEVLLQGEQQRSCFWQCQSSYAGELLRQWWQWWQKLPVYVRHMVLVSEPLEGSRLR